MFFQVTKRWDVIKMRDNIAIPLLDTLQSDIKSRLKDGRNHAEIFVLRPSVMFTPEYEINEVAAALRKQFSADLPNHGSS